MSRKFTRKVEDIGLLTIDRPRSSCRYATAFCKAHCYNNKFYSLWPNNMTKADERNCQAWEELTGPLLREELSRKRVKVHRLRLMSRGEAFSEIEDVIKVLDILQENPTVQFWIPTRAWRNEFVRTTIELLVLPVANARVMASVDPSNTKKEVKSLLNSGWNLMGFGWKNKEEMEEQFGIKGVVNCPKTHEGVKGHCAVCESGCFKKANVFLDKH